jgi:S1-C subfamily serine protease
VVSKIEPGSKTSVSGIKPYEVITHVNDKPIMTAAEFGAALEGQNDLRLSIKRMNRGRVVKIALDEAEPAAPVEKPEAAPAGN